MSNEVQDIVLVACLHRESHFSFIYFCSYGISHNFSNSYLPSFFPPTMFINFHFEL